MNIQYCICTGVSDLQLLIRKSFLIEKAVFGNKTLDQHFGANFKKPVFWWILLQISCFYLAFCHSKMLKMTSWTSVWHAQHPNAGQNIQQLILNIFYSVFVHIAPLQIQYCMFTSYPMLWWFLVFKWKTNHLILFASFANLINWKIFSNSIEGFFLRTF